LRPELETYHLIDSYLNGKLEGEALRTFEAQLQSDPAFAEEVSFQQLTNEVVVGASYDDLRSQMTKDIDKIDASANIKKWSLYTVAALVLLSGGIGYYTHSQQETDSKPTVTKEANPTTQSSASSKTPDVVITQSPKIVSSKKEHSNSTNITESAVTIVEAPTPQIQQPAPTATSTPDVKTTQPVEHATSVNPCMNAQITAEISTKPSCINENTGSILIPQVQGGTSPYTLALDHATGKPLKETYSYLSAGTHSLLITDKNGCSKEFHATIAEKNCKKTSYVFAPEKGETWKISGNENSDYTITILNMAGTQVYKSHVMQGEFEWQGMGQQGEYLSSGLYIYIIEYTNGQKENGQVTIVR
jgi:Predicted solute binding protein